KNPQPRKKDPPPKKEEPPPRKEEPPPRKEEPPPRKEEPPSPPVKTEPKLDERLKPFVVALKSKKSEERLRAVEELGKLGNVARPAAQAVCEVLVTDTTPALREAALAALEKIHPELHKQLVVLVAEADAEKHQKAARELAQMGEEGRAAVPVLLAHLKSAPARFPAEVTSVVSEDVQALAQLAPADPTVQKAILATTTLTALDQIQQEVAHPARKAAIQTLSELVQKHPEQAKHVVPG